MKRARLAPTMHSMRQSTCGYALSRAERASCFGCEAHAGQMLGASLRDDADRLGGPLKREKRASSGQKYRALRDHPGDVRCPSVGADSATCAFAERWRARGPPEPRGSTLSRQEPRKAAYFWPECLAFFLICGADGVRLRCWPHSWGAACPAIRCAGRALRSH